MTAESSSLTAVPTDRSDRGEVLQRGLGDLIARGAIAGLFSGFVFLIANMGWAVKDDKPAVAPMIDISTIFHNQDMPKPVEALEFGPDNLVVGTTTHLTLSMVFGIGFALVAAAMLRDRGAGLLALGGIGYGLLLYVVNFQVLGRIVFEWFTNPMGPDQGFEVFIHAVFGLLLVPFFLGAIPRSPGRAASAG